jgi:hypothetical protein
LKRYKSPGTDQIPAEQIQAGGKAQPQQWNESTITPIYEKDDKTKFIAIIFMDWSC